MSVTMNVVEFERQEAHLSSELDSGPPYTVHGIALGEGDVTRGASGIKKLWPEEELRRAANSLEGTNLVEDHENESRGVIGQVTKAGYKEDVGVLYEAELFDDDLASKISNGLLEVSVRGFHNDVEEMDTHDETGAKIVEDIEFDNLSVVASGASPSNTLAMGSHDELSAAELSNYVSTLQEIEPGMWVKSDGTKGITISQVQDGEIEVDIYEERDGQWRSKEQTEMFDIDSLTEWDVDEDDIGPAEDEDDEEDEEEDSEENAELVSTDDTVQWDDGSAQGVVVDRKTDGCFSDRIDGDQEICASEDEAVVLIEIVKDGERTDTMVAHKEGTVNSADFEFQEMAFEEGMMVQWQADASRFGKVVHNPEDEDFVMIEIMKQEDGEMVPTGNTVSAFPSDIQEMDEEEMSALEELESFTDYPEAASENAQMALDAREETDNPNDCGTQTGWTRANQLANKESLSEDVVAKMSSFNRHRQNSDMDDEEGKADCGWMMWKAWGGDEGVDWAMRKMEKIEEENMELGKHHHEASMEMVDEFMGEEGNDEETFVSAFLEWADDDNVRQAVDEFVAKEDNSLESAMTDFISWLESKVDESEQSKHGEMEEDEEEMAKHHHEASMEAINQFLDSTPEDADGMERPVSDLVEFADDDAIDRAVAEFVEADGSMDASVGDFQEWLEGVVEEATQHEDAEGAEFTGEQGKGNQPWRYPDVDGDTEPDEPESSGVHEDLSDEEVADAVLQDWEFHSPDWTGTTDEEWSSPDMEDFDTDDLSEIDDHFLISQTGFPPDNFTELALPVVEPNGDLSLSALRAVKGGRGVSAVEGLTDEMEQEITDWVNATANEEFDKDWGMEENAKMDPDVEDDREAETMSPIEATLDLINIFLRQNGKDERDSVDKMLGWLFSSTDVPTEKIEAVRVAANAFLDAQGGADSFDAVDIESFRSWLLTQGGQTDDGVHARPTEPQIATPVHVLSGDDLHSAYMTGESKKDDSMDNTNMTDIEAELAELDEPVAVEKDDFESLQEKADRMDEMSETLASLQERTDVLDSVDREQVEELAEADEPLVLESSEYEELTTEAEEVKEVYAEALSGDDSPFTASELSDKFSIEELREKYDEAGHELQEELSAAPKSGDPSEEELEERAEEEEQSESEAELSEEIQSKQEELRAKITGN